MNERFRLLADQAQIGIFEDKAFGWSVIAGTDQHLAKFAELIVAECLEACSRANDIKHFVPPTQEQVVLSCMREIETTFRS
jgi:hypothetical protein